MLKENKQERRRGKGGEMWERRDYGEVHGGCRVRSDEGKGKARERGEK